MQHETLEHQRELSSPFAESDLQRRRAAPGVRLAMSPAGSLQDGSSRARLLLGLHPVQERPPARQRAKLGYLNGAAVLPAHRFGLSAIPQLESARFDHQLAG